MTLEEYIHYRTGEKEIPRIILAMLVKPFKADSLRKFWMYWNPGYGYYLLYYCYQPLRKIFPDWLSFILTFLLSGIAHDVFYILPMLLINNGNIPIPFVAIWFLLIALGILLTDCFQINFKKLNTVFYPFIHFAFLGITFYITRSIGLFF